MLSVMTEAPAPKKKILVVDDNRDGAESLSLLLGMHGYDVRVMHTGLGVRELCLHWKPEAVFMDIGLPGLNGYAVCHSLRAAGLGMPLVALTGYGSEADRRRALESGFTVHVLKPADPDLIVNLLRSLCG